MPDARNASQSKPTPWKRLVCLASLVLVALIGARAAGARLAAPVPISPSASATTDGVPAFAWNAVANADQYEFQVAADGGFNSPVLGRGQDDFLTRNTRATLKKTVPNGTYWWRVRALTADGGASPWSQGRSFKKLWAATTKLLTPANGAAVVYPTTPLKLSWTPVPGARKYLVSIAYDPSLGSLVPGSGVPAGPVETTATTFTRPAALAPGTYYWGITPVDAEGNRGVRSQVGSFTWVWPSQATTRVVDLNAAPEVYDPQFSWGRVPGAARYQVEVSSSQDFAPGSTVCCTAPTIATSLSPTVVLPNNTYYWRVRALDVDGNAGVWNVGPPFTKTFDNVPPVAGTSVGNLHMRDNTTDATVAADADHDLSNGFQSGVPIVSWNPVPGASSYRVEVAPFESVNGAPADCNWTSSTLPSHLWKVTTATTAWTPLGTHWNAKAPFGNPTTVATDSAELAAGSYCVRVTPRSDHSGSADGFGDTTFLTAGSHAQATDPHAPAFTWTGYPSGLSAGCNVGYLCGGDYFAPAAGPTACVDPSPTAPCVTRAPLFTWKPLTGAQSYFVIVAKDPTFTNIVDYAFTQVPAYAPRSALGAKTYSDETTLYYWAVLPASAFNGDGAKGDPLSAAAPNFQKQSTPPTLLGPANGAMFSGPPTFQWTPVEGARHYRLQVSQDPSFGSVIEDVTTDSTAYTSNTTYPADTVLYWRVRADDENFVGLTWRPRLVEGPATFQQKLPMPDLAADNPAAGDFIPTWSWGSVDGAVAYDVSADLPDGTHREIMGLRTPVLTPVLMYGTGVFSWRVRAEFPKSPIGTTPGPYTATHTFARTIGEPTGMHTEAGIDRVLLSWNAKPQVRGYNVQLSARPTFIQTLESVTTDNTSYAPSLKWFAISGLDTGRIYWRVAAIDEGNNVGDYTAPQLISRTRRMRITVTGAPRARRLVTLMINVKNFESGAGVTGAVVRVSGAGLRVRRLRTTIGGIVQLRVRPKRKGTLLLRASARGYRATQLRLRVR
jgi:hypothetical protein